MAVLLGETPRHYARSKEFLATGESFNKISVGVPLQLLSSRPDVRQAERTIESAFYGVNQARSAFYPSLTLSGSVGWTNSAGMMIVNPGKVLASAAASLVAPVFTRGQNEAQLKIAKAQQEEGEARLYADPAQCGQGGERCLDGLSDFGEEGGDDSLSNRVA